MESSAQRQGVWNTYLTEKNNRPPAVGGNGAALALGIAQGALGAYGGYSDAKYKETMATKK